MDGVALKQAVDAWASAPDAEKAARFGNAETVRWLEWGVRSYFSFVFGLSLVGVGALGLTAGLPRGIAGLMAASGRAFFAQGWILGAEGFSSRNSLPTLGAYAL